MNSRQMMKNIPFTAPVRLIGLVDYEEGRVVSRTLAQNSGVSLTLFAFDAGDGSGRAGVGQVLAGSLAYLLPVLNGSSDAPKLREHSRGDTVN